MTDAYADRQQIGAHVIGSLNVAIARHTWLIDPKRPWPGVWDYVSWPMAEFLVALSAWELVGSEDLKDRVNDLFDVVVTNRPAMPARGSPSRDGTARTFPANTHRSARSRSAHWRGVEQIQARLRHSEPIAVAGQGTPTATKASAEGAWSA